MTKGISRKSKRLCITPLSSRKSVCIVNVKKYQNIERRLSKKYKNNSIAKSNAILKEYKKSGGKIKCTKGSKLFFIKIKSPKKICIERRGKRVIHRHIN